MADTKNAPGTTVRGVPQSGRASVPRRSDRDEPPTGNRCPCCGRVSCMPWRKWLPAMHAMIDFVRDFSYEQGQRDGYRAAEEAMCGAIRESFDPNADTLAEAAETVLRRIDAKRYRQQVAEREPVPWVPVDWPDAVVRLPGESQQHYRWRCGKRGAA